MSETAIIQIKVDAREAMKTIAETREAAIGLGGGLDALVASLDKVQAEMRELANLNGGAIPESAKKAEAALKSEIATLKEIESVQIVHSKTTTAAATANLTMAEAARTLQQRIAPQAAAISNISAAMGDMQGVTGRVAAGAGQLAAAFAAGGPLGLALAATVEAVGILTYAWEKDLEAQDKALSKAFSPFEAAASQGHAISADIATLRGSLGLTTASEVFNATESEIAGIRSRIASNKKAQFDPSLVGGAFGEKGEMLAKENQQLEKNIELLERKRLLEIAALNKGHEGDLTAQRQEAAAIQAAQLALDEQDRQFRQGHEDAIHAIHNDRVLADIAADREAADEKRVIAKQERDDQLEIETIAAEMSVALEKQRTAEFVAMAEQRKAVNEKESQFALSIAGSTYDGLTSTFMDYVDMRIMGEEDAELKATQAFLRGVGNQLVGLGTKAAIEGALISLNPATPGAGIPLMLAGGAAVTAGFAMGATASFVGREIAGNEQARAAEALRGDIASGRHGGGSLGRAGGGSVSSAAVPVIVNITYGVGGTMENAGRDLAKLIESMGAQGQVPREFLR